MSENLNRESQVLQDLDSLINTEKKLTSGAANEGPQVFTIGGKKYETNFSEEKLLPAGEEEGVTPIDLMKAALPDTFKSYHKRLVSYPDKFLNLGRSSRLRIIKAVQAHNLMPPATPETRQFTPLFQWMSSHLDIQSNLRDQFNACNWALNYSDPDLAASMLIHYGYFWPIEQ